MSDAVNILLVDDEQRNLDALEAILDDPGYKLLRADDPQLAEAPPWSAALSEQMLPDDEMARSRRVAALYRLLDKLSDKKRAVFVLHELEGLSPAEIGKIVGAPVLTVRTRLFYARRELAALMRDEPVLAAIADELAGEPAE